ncbi:MAG: gamma carbonic anhydrase family protein [Deltaproteobacteria bacterium]|nr:gamma carbonic anhydrase family protein [Deltaproteobacteria bacterium]
MLYRFDGNQPVVGKDSYISETASVIGNVLIGNNCYVGHGVILRGDYGRIEIGNGTALEEGVLVHAGPGKTYKIGKRVTAGHCAVLHGEIISDNAVIGMGAIVSLFSKIGEWAIVAEGSIVKSKQVVPPRVVVAGNPARFVRDLKEKDKEFWKGGKQTYIDLAKKYLDIGMHPV